MRAVLIATAIGIALNLLLTIWATAEGWLNANSWGTAVILALLLAGALYHLSKKQIV